MRAKLCKITFHVVNEVFTTDFVQRVITVKKPMTIRWFGFKDLDYFHPEIWGNDAI